MTRTIEEGRDYAVMQASARRVNVTYCASYETARGGDTYRPFITLYKIQGGSVEEVERIIIILKKIIKKVLTEEVKKKIQGNYGKKYEDILVYAVMPDLLEWRHVLGGLGVREIWGAQK